LRLAAINTSDLTVQTSRAHSLVFRHEFLLSGDFDVSEERDASAPLSGLAYLLTLKAEKTYLSEESL
jgi:hypothetical protein